MAYIKPNETCIHCEEVFKHKSKIVKITQGSLALTHSGMSRLHVRSVKSDQDRIYHLQCFLEIAGEQFFVD